MLTHEDFQEAPKWRNNWCEGNEDMNKLIEEIKQVKIPTHDPVYGKDGPLVRLWTQSRRQNRL